jgi:hypothetical protein
MIQLINKQKTKKCGYFKTRRPKYLGNGLKSTIHKLANGKFYFNSKMLEILLEKKSIAIFGSVTKSRNSKYRTLKISKNSKSRKTQNPEKLKISKNSKSRKTQNLEKFKVSKNSNV